MIRGAGVALLLLVVLGLSTGAARSPLTVEGFDSGTRVVREIVEALVVGQQWEDDLLVVLFVRLREGLDLADFRHRFGLDFQQRHEEAVARLLADNLIELTDRHLRLSRTGTAERDALMAEFEADC